MLQIALCDDEAEQRAQIGGLLQRYSSTRPNLAARLTVFSTGAELLEHPADFELYVLDVVMPGLSGIDLGVKLREQGRDGAIVYLTTSPDYAVDSYLAEAFYYLLKPVDPVRLYGVLDKAAALMQKRRAASLQVKTKDGLRLLPLDGILYAELAGRAARYYLSGGETVDSVTFHTSFQKEMEPLLRDSRFVLCGSSFAVNLHYVTAVDKDAVTVGGARVPLSRGYYNEVKKRWGNYWLNGRDESC